MENFRPRKRFLRLRSALIKTFGAAGVFLLLALLMFLLLYWSFVSYLVVREIPEQTFAYVQVRTEFWNKSYGLGDLPALSDAIAFSSGQNKNAVIELLEQSSYVGLLWFENQGQTNSLVFVKLRPVVSLQLDPSHYHRISDNELVLFADREIYSLYESLPKKANLPVAFSRSVWGRVFLDKIASAKLTLAEVPRYDLSFTAIRVNEDWIFKLNTDLPVAETSNQGIPAEFFDNPKLVGYFSEVNFGFFNQIISKNPRWSQLADRLNDLSKLDQGQNIFSQADEVFKNPADVFIARSSIDSVLPYDLAFVWNSKSLSLADIKQLISKFSISASPQIVPRQLPDGSQAKEIMVDPALVQWQAMKLPKDKQIETTLVNSIPLNLAIGSSTNRVVGGTSAELVELALTAGKESPGNDIRYCPGGGAQSLVLAFDLGNVIAGTTTPLWFYGFVAEGKMLGCFQR